ncbi:uncharacterized protein LOC143462864 isoform X1 [Clavelina lepadiformis]|uniref:uncharacterized protein LOC143462864 isoform X1 n=1 Tax=Clavelina lepadiformis TaxID=159417 RepID=UPI004042A733
MSADAGLEENKTEESKPNNLHSNQVLEYVSTSFAPSYEAASSFPSVSTCPRGLECLLPLDQVTITTTDAAAALGTVQNKAGQCLFNLKKTYGPSFNERTISFSNNNGEEILRRAVSVNGCCLGPVVCPCPGLGPGMLVESIEAPPGQQVAKTQQMSAWFGFRFHIYDESNTVRLILNSNCFGNNWTVVTTSGSQIGEMVWNYPFGGGKKLTVTFPMDLDVRLKGALLWIMIYCKLYVLYGMISESMTLDLSQ